jgi:hypothetical protein
MPILLNPSADIVCSTEKVLAGAANLLLRVKSALASAFAAKGIA